MEELMRRHFCATIIIFLFFASISGAQNQLVNALVLLKDKQYKSAEVALTAIIREYLTTNSSDQTLLIDGYTVKPSFLYSSRGNAWFGMGKYDQALTDYLKSYQLSGIAEILYDIANCLYETGEYAAAIAKFDEYLKTDPSRNGKYLARYFRALSIFQSGNRDLAIHSLEAMKSEFPELEGSIQNAIGQCISEKIRIDE